MPDDEKQQQKEKQKQPPQSKNADGAVIGDDPVPNRRHGNVYEPPIGQVEGGPP